jgi:hypothetical protein
MKERKDVPFFARLLEEQELPKVKTNVKAGPKPPKGGGGPPLVTMKYPSDDDEDPPVVI